MNTAQTDCFADHGYVRLEGFHPRKRMMAVRQKLLDELKRVSEGKGMPASVRGLPVFQQIGKLSSLVRLPGLHESLVTQALLAEVTRLAGRMPKVVQDVELLLSPPRQGAWTLQGLNWHVDVAAKPPGRLPGIQAFFLIDDVAGGGGGTLALAGSHRVDMQPDGASSRLRRILRTAEDLERELDGLKVRVVEMSGRAGDVFLMDMRLLHTPSVNSAQHVRMMATSRCFLAP